MEKRSALGQIPPLLPLEFLMKGASEYERHKYLALVEKEYCGGKERLTPLSTWSKFLPNEMSSPSDRM